MASNNPGVAAHVTEREAAAAELERQHGQQGPAEELLHQYALDEEFKRAVRKEFEVAVNEQYLNAFKKYAASRYRGEADDFDPPEDDDLSRPTPGEEDRKPHWADEVGQVLGKDSGTVSRWKSGDQELSWETAFVYLAVSGSDTTEAGFPSGEQAVQGAMPQVLGYIRRQGLKKAVQQPLAPDQLEVLLLFFGDRPWREATSVEQLKKVMRAGVKAAARFLPRKGCKTVEELKKLVGAWLEAWVLYDHILPDGEA